MPQIRPSRGTHLIFAREDLPLRAGAIVPAGGGRTIFALPWLGRTLVGTTDNDYEGELDHVQPAARGHRLPARCRQRVLRHLARPRRPHRRVRRRAPADLERRPEDVGRHLAQGRAVRDLERDDHDHRRQADDVAADGEDDRRPDRRARRPRRALPHRRRSRSGRRSRRGAAARGGGAARSPTRRSPPATATRRMRCSRSRPSAPSSPSRSSPACPTCSPRSARGAPRAGARSATCCCAARASGCSPRRELAGGVGRVAPVARRRRARARAGLGLERARTREIERFARRPRAGGDEAAEDARDARGRPCDPRAALRATLLELGSAPLLMGSSTPRRTRSATAGARDARAARRAGARAVRAGADIIDIGGESATHRPPAGAGRGGDRARLPLVERVAAELGAIVSVDTYKPAVARAAIAAGAQDRQRRQRAARSRARRGVRGDGRRARADAHARRAQAAPAGPRPLRRTSSARCSTSCASASQLALAAGWPRAADRRPGPRLRQDPAQTIELLANSSACTSWGGRC